MSDEIRISRNEFGLWVSRLSPRQHPFGQSLPYWREERLYLHPDGLWRTACVTADGLRGYFTDADQLAAALMASLTEIGQQTCRKTFVVRIDGYGEELSRVAELIR